MWKFTYKTAFYILLAYGALPKRGNDAKAAFSSFKAELLHNLKGATPWQIRIHMMHRILLS